MKKFADTYSLLPFLRGQGGVVFSFCRDEQQRGQQLTDNPFMVLTESDPVAAVIKARFSIDSATTLKDMFCLIQKNRYDIRPDSVTPVTNKKVDDVWHKAFAYYQSKPHLKLLPLPSQISAEGSLRPLAPLFFCKKKAIFFGPPCPECGRPLGLNLDDDYLGGYGLQPYSRSTARYLSCPSDTCPGSSTFYVYERSRLDPAGTKDWRDLVADFSSISLDVDKNLNLPCIDCVDRLRCYEKGHVTKIIHPFSFYPFHMLAFEAPSIHALDFSALLSGADPDTLADRLARRGEHARIACVKQASGNSGNRFLFSDESRQFLEILYLKLSLLSAIIDSVPDAHEVPLSDFRFSIENSWIKLSGQNDFLPSFWSFTVHPLGIYRPFAEGPAAETVPSQTVYYLAHVWFHILIGNEDRNGDETERIIREPGLTFAHVPPSRIFWSRSSDCTPAPEETRTRLWEDALAMGRKLLQASMDESRPWSRKAFLGELEELRKLVHDQLFGTHIIPPASQPGAQTSLSAAPNTHLDDAAIQKIILGIMAEYTRKTEQGPADHADPPLEPGITSGTVTRQTDKNLADSPAPVANDFEKTHIISLADTGQEKVSATAPAQEDGHDDLDATVIISAATGQAAGTESANDGRGPDDFPDDDIEEKTVIISLSGNFHTGGTK